jgi:hypothetical protein
MAHTIFRCQIELKPYATEWLYRSYLRIGARGDLAIQYMRQIADDLDAIREAQAGKFSGQALGSEASPAAAKLIDNQRPRAVTRGALGWPSAS